MIQGFEYGTRDDAAETYKAQALALIRLWEALTTSNRGTRDTCKRLGHIWHGDRCLGCEAIDTGGVTRGPIGSEKP